MLDKKAKLPLSKVMLGEVKGGWGRTIQGAMRMVKKMSKTDEGRAAANDLQVHLDMVEYCKMLWPEHIMTLTQAKLDTLISAFGANKVEFQDQVKVLLVQRRALAAVGSGNKEVKDIDLASTIFDILCPLCKEGAAPKFNPRAPRMCDVSDNIPPNVLWEKAATIFTKRLLVPRITGGAQN